MSHDAPDEGERALSRLGYAQELLRAMGGFSSFALSFSIISVLTGIFSTYGDALRAGGPAGLGLGWPLVSAGTLVVAVAMGELASAFPTAGALYHWAALLGGRGAGWITAMMNLAGQIAIVAAIDLACAQSICAMMGSDRTLRVFALVLSGHATLNILSVRIVAWLNDLSAPVHILGVAVLVTLLFVFGRAQPVSFLAQTGFSQTQSSYAVGFLESLVLGMWTFTGYDASAHVSEETRDPARKTPRAIILAVAVSAACGYALVAALTLAIKDVAAASKGNAAFEVLQQSLGHKYAGAVYALAAVAMWFCGLSSVTSASRMMFALARDGGLPFSDALKKVSPRLKTPVAATLVATGAPALLVYATAPFSDALFLAIASLATTALYISYALPIALGARARARGVWKKMGPFHLGRAGMPVAWISVAWTALVLVVGFIANRLGFAILVGTVIALALTWLLLERRRFRGPPVSLEHFQND